VTVKRVAILGSTGSIGRSALAVVDAHPTRLKVVSLAAGENASLLAEQVQRYCPEVVAMAAGEGIDRLKAACGLGLPAVGTGTEGLIAVATHPSADIVICASAGTAGLEAVLAAIEAGKTIALANKEVLVMAGELVTAAARRRGVAILPVDSEHNAIHQCLHARPASEVRRIILTASGGPFRDYQASALEQVGPEAALQHPTWQMGRKITVDSATLMNKGLEVIEARWLFDVTAERVQVVVHPQSVVHSMVEYVDGSVIAQLGVADMGIPILYALTYPRRLPCPAERLDLTRVGSLSFEEPDTDRFPCLSLARQALEAGECAPAILNAANEVAVAAFLAGQIRFTRIPALIAEALGHVPNRPLNSIDTCVDIDAETRRVVQGWLSSPVLAGVATR
jgi:1-deoxy-D-xylulose-5-phosphate reductoisomerase